MLEFTLIDKVDFKFDVLDISEIDQSVELSLDITFLYVSSQINYKDRLWFETQSIKLFISNLTMEKNCVFTNIDEDFLMTIKNNKLNIEIDKKGYFLSPLKIRFNTNIDDEIYKIRQSFDSLCI